MILTKPPYGCEESEKALRMLAGMIEQGENVAMYIVGDGVELTMKSQKGDLGKLLSELADKGAEIYSSSEDMEARGLSSDKVLPCVKPTARIFEEIVEDAMERADKLLSC